MITADQLLELAPTARVPLVDELAPAFNLMLPAWQIDTPLRLAHFLAQAAHETASFRTLVEIGGPKKSYAPYYGRGVFQYTHEGQYAKLGQRLGLPLLRDPDRLATPHLGTIAACIYWADHNLWRWADEDNAVAIGRAINRGSATSDKPAYGEDERLALTVKAKQILGIVPADDHSTKALQSALNRLGAKPRLKVDGDLGPLTAEAIRRFQAANGLVTSGIADVDTWERVRDALEQLDA